MRSKAPVVGTSDSSSVRAASLPKSTVLANFVTSPVVRVSAWSFSRHHVPRYAAPAAASAIVTPAGMLVRSGTGSLPRKARLNRRAPPADSPPGVVADRVTDGARYAPSRHSPTPAAIRTCPVPGSQAACGTVTVTCRRSASTAAVAPGMSSTVAPWTVRKRAAGERTPAPCGHGTGTGDVPSAMVKADSGCSTLRVTRKSVASAVGLTRSSTRSAASLP